MTSAVNVSSGSRHIAGWRVRWDELRAEAAYAAGWWVRHTLADALKQCARETPDRVLVVEGAQRMTCRGLHDAAVCLAQQIRARIPERSVVSFMLPNWAEAATIYHAITLAGMVAHPILPSLRDRELKFMLEDIGSRMIFIPRTFRDFDFLAMLARVAGQMQRPPQIVVLRGDPEAHLDYASLLENGLHTELPELHPDAVRLVLYTSGTTGVPKAVLHSHNSIHALVRQISQQWRVAPGDAFLVASPIGHIGGSIYAFECPLLLGARAVLMEKWQADVAVKLAQAECITHMAGATPFLEQLLEAAQRESSELPQLKVFICGGASVPPTLIRRAAAYFTQAVVTRVYGSTEVPVTTVGAFPRADLVHAAETDGRTGIAEVNLVDSRGRPCEVGEICARGPQMLVGYLHPEDEVNAFDAEGYYKTGDIGRRVDGDYLVICGRAKDIIIRNGENISPKEVEDVLSAHPGVAEITVVGLPHPRTGERAFAVIVPKEQPAPSLASLCQFLGAQGMATFKFPEQLAVWESIPKNDAGKVLKHAVRAELMRQLQGG
jgi:acyl-CoA synthetase (AMP-forming)/AMP-acid ligase II